MKHIGNTYEQLMAHMKHLWNTSETHMGHRWNTNQTHMNTNETHETQMKYKWNTNNTLMKPLWNIDVFKNPIGDFTYISKHICLEILGSNV